MQTSGIAQIVLPAPALHATSLPFANTLFATSLSCLPCEDKRGPLAVVIAHVHQHVMYLLRTLSHTPLSRRQS